MCEEKKHLKNTSEIFSETAPGEQLIFLKSQLRLWTTIQLYTLLSTVERLGIPTPSAVPYAKNLFQEAFLAL